VVLQKASTWLNEIAVVLVFSITKVIKPFPNSPLPPV
jgi:hypothetical protein